MIRFYLQLAAKNLFRHKRRTFLTAAAIGVGMSFYIFLDSFLIGFERDAVANLLDHETGEVQVVTAASVAEEFPALKESLLPDGIGLAEEIAALPGVRAVSPRLFFQATIGNGLEEIPLLGAGVEPAAEAAAFANSRFVKEGGRWLRPGRGEAVLGAGVAELLGLGVGDTVTIRTQTSAAAFQALDLTLVGLFATPNPNINQNWLFVPLDIAQDALAADGALTQVSVRLQDPEGAGEMAERIRSLPGFGPHLLSRTWHESAADFLAMLQAERAYDGFLLFLVMVIAVIGAINTILLASLERVREIGMLKAIGLTEGGITALFVAEGIILGALGWLLGLAAALPVNHWLVAVGFDMRAAMGEMMAEFSYPMSDRIYGVWNWGAIFGTLAAAVFISLAASYLPARRAARLDPAAALRRLG